MLLIAVLLLTAPPLAVAEDPAPAAGSAGPMCVDVNPESPNPVYVYECPAATGG